MIPQCHVDYSLDLLFRMVDLNLLFGFRVILPPGYEGYTFLGLWFCLFPHVIFSCPCLFMSFCQMDDLRRTVSLIWVYVTVIHFILKVGLSFCSLQFVVLINRNSLKHLDGRKSLYKATSKGIQGTLQGIVSSDSVPPHFCCWRYRCAHLFSIKLIKCGFFACASRHGFWSRISFISGMFFCE